MITQEVRFFLGSFFSGVFLLMAYDMIRLLRVLIPHRKALVNGEDFIFWAGASIFIFRTIYKLNDGNIRGFGILCMVAGMLLYQFFAKIVKKGLKKAAKPFKMRVRKVKGAQKAHRNEERHESRQADKEKR